MSFVNAYPNVKNCVVAIAPKFYKEQRVFPDILGTGFLVSRSGIVCTCRHVADAVRRLPKPPDYQGYPALALLFMDFVYRGQPGVGVLAIDIEQIGDATVIGNGASYLGPNPPDISFILQPVTETSAVPLASAPLQEGEEIAFAGFPDGDENSSGTWLAPPILAYPTPRNREHSFAGSFGKDAACLPSTRQHAGWC